MDELGALILNGGASTRMGADKGGLDWWGRSALQRCRSTTAAVGADPILVVGPGGEVEDPQLGPVGGVLAGAAALRALGIHRALILAVDAPTIEVKDLVPLLSAGDPGAAFEGLHLPMVIALDALAEDAQCGWPLARLAERAGLRRLAPAPEARERLRGANTPVERERLLQAPAAPDAAWERRPR
ncbi:NTP transferase domain-containing protein [Caulobacter segnis]|nr:NTP transferase domain-containing protein [Caulobacter segnis]MDG2522160.1 NTP transferase domain-containing protein [Caulobacter segnis]